MAICSSQYFTPLLNQDESWRHLDKFNRINATQDFQRLLTFLSKDSDELLSICLEYPQNEHVILLLMFMRMQKCFSEWNRLSRQAAIRMRQLMNACVVQTS